MHSDKVVSLIADCLCCRYLNFPELDKVLGSVPSFLIVSIWLLPFYVKYSKWVKN